MITAHARVLLVEHHTAGRSFLVDNLQADGYEVLVATDGAASFVLLGEPLDALLVDFDGDTLSLIDTIRSGVRLELDPQLPILVLSSHAGQLQRTRLLERGADDVVEKPYSYPELRARLAALLRRAKARRTSEVLRAGSLRLDVRSRRAWVGEIEVEPLRGKEYQLLLALAQEPGRVFTREELLANIWGLGPYARTRTLDSHAARLRARLQINGERFVHNVWGVGYSLTNGANCI